MPSFSPTIINNTTPAVEVTINNVSYGEIKRSLGDYVYYVDKIYMLSNLYNQVSGVVKFQIYDVNGNKKVDNLTPIISPYQYQPALYYDTKDYDVVLNGQSNFKFNLLPNSQLMIDFYSKRVAKRDALDLLYPDNFKTLESAMGNYSFFEGWKDEI